MSRWGWFDGYLKSKHISMLTPEAYGEFLQKMYSMNILNAELDGLINGRDALYDYRMDLSYSSSDGMNGADHLKVTKMTSLDNESQILWDPNGSMEALMVTWLSPIVRPFVLDQECTDHPVTVDDITTNYHLELERKIDIRFEKVKNVQHIFPLTAEETEKVLGDIFLSELVKKRSDKEFTDIIFTIQRKQGEIIRQNFSQNIIVQGCAGSGKSMIMLHRLPVLLYDHLVQKSNVYIISPSQSYIQLVNNMRKQLQIYDISMGTLNQYYEMVINRYSKHEKVYDRINPTALTYETENYLYSEKAIFDMNAYLCDRINDIPYDIENLYAIFNEKTNIEEQTTWYNVISKRIIKLNHLLTLNNDVITTMFKAVKIYLTRISGFVATLSSRIKKILMEMNKVKSEQVMIQNKAEEEIQKLDATTNEKAIKNREKVISDAKHKIIKVENDINEITKDTDYQDYISELRELANTQIHMFDKMDDVKEKNDTRTLYMLFNKYQALEALYNQMLCVESECEDKYSGYISPIKKELFHLGELIESIKQADVPKIEYRTFKELNKTFEKYKSLGDSIISDTYYYIFEKSGYVFNEKRKNVGNIASPYIFLQICYLYYGQPNSSGENLIAIDEAQNLSPNEFVLIRNVNKNVIFNVFGDVKQHIENTKGINSWDEISEVCELVKYDLNENYRNASQITNYCNKKFAMEMVPINLDGTGVSEYVDMNDFILKLKNRQRKLSGTGLSAIIVANDSEAKDIGRKIAGPFASQGNTLNDLTKDNSEIYDNKWNLMTVGQAKGLEFNCVIAVISNMTANEKYIACTRALDELIVYCGEYKLENKVFFPDESQIQEVVMDKPQSEIDVL